MTPLNVTDKTLEILPEPGNPNVPMLRLWLATRHITPDNWPEVGVTTYKTLVIDGPKPRGTEARWDDYKLVWMDEGFPGYLELGFVKRRSDEEKWTPVRSFTDGKLKEWPSVLEGLVMGVDSAAPNSVSAPSDVDPSGRRVVYIDRKIPFLAYTPQTLALCRVQMDIFMADTPYEIGTFLQPVPGNISWNFGAQGSGSFTGLHPRVVIQRPASSYRIVEDATPGTVDAPFQKDLIFPATEMEDWEPHIIIADQTFTRGLYTYTRGRVYPPSKPEAVRTS